MDRSAVMQLYIALCLTVLVVETYSSISWASEVVHRPKRQAGCREDEFRCTSGECIDSFSMCDGTKECADGSDETEAICKQLSINASPPQGGCLLPQPPETGSYSSPVCQFDDKSAVCRKVPGTPVPHGWFLIFKCNEGYYFNETRDENLFVYCQNGKWSNTPKCKKMCPPLVSLSVAVRCFNGQDEIDCSRPMLPGVRAQGECKPSYTQIQPLPYTSIFCRDNGQWTFELFYCQPVCGKRNTQGVVNPLIVSSTKRGEFPWHVGLYMPNATNQWEQTCGGSLISPHIVLTAAHCVFSEQTKMKIHPEALKVGLGKYYRELTTEEPDSVTANVREILIPSEYYGHATSYALDIALIDLKFSVQVHASIMPVCVDWRREYTLTPGMNGVLAGWGKTENGKSSDVLLYAELPYIDYHNCINEVPNVFRHYVTSDKFCAGFKNGTGAVSGDNGGGLTFVQDGLYHVYGIVSTKLKGTESFATFTNITNEELFSWLIKAKETFDKNHTET